MQEEAVIDQVGDGGSEKVTPEWLTMIKEEIKGINDDGLQDVYGRRDSAENTRYCIWPNQWPDGRKHKGSAEGAKDVFPFEGASDGRIRIADMIVNERVMIQVLGAYMAQVSVLPVEGGDMRKAARIRTLAKWLKNVKLRMPLLVETTKVAQYQEADSPGAAIMGVYWHEEESLRPVTLTVEQFVAMMLDKYQAEWTPAMIDGLAQMLADPKNDEELAATIRSYVPHLQESRAKKLVKELRETGEATFPEPYTKRAEPRLCAHRLFEDAFIPSNTTELQTARCLIVSEWLTKPELKSRQVTDGYAEEFVRQVVGHKDAGGNVVHKGQEGVAAFPEKRRTQAGEFAALEESQEYRGLYNVLTAYFIASNEDGLPAVYTVPVHHNVDVAAKEKELLGYPHGGYPGVLFRREVLNSRALDSRGIPELAASAQTSLKILNDSFEDHAQISGIPPINSINRKSRSQLKIGPLVELRSKRDGQIKFMQPPQYPSTVDKQQQERRRQINEYFGRADNEVDPSLVQLHRQWITLNFQSNVAEVFVQALNLYIANTPAEKLARVMGCDPEEAAALKDEQDLLEQYDLQVTFDPRFMDFEFLKGVAEMYQKVILPLDLRGQVKTEVILESVFMAFDPNIADRALRPVEEADQNEIEDEQKNWTLMAAGVEPPMQEAGQNFPLRMQVLQGIMERNPEATVNWPETNRAILEARMQHLAFMTQQLQNAQTGRVGAEPALQG